MSRLFQQLRDAIEDKGGVLTVTETHVGRVLRAELDGRVLREIDTDIPAEYHIAFQLGLDDFTDEPLP